MKSRTKTGNIIRSNRIGVASVAICVVILLMANMNVIGAFEPSDNRWWKASQNRSNKQWGPRTINIDDAWDLEGDGSIPNAYRFSNPGKNSIVVAVIDSGINTDHADLNDMMWENPGETWSPAGDGDGNNFNNDVNGWNFLNGNNNIKHSNEGTDYEMAYHGTRVGGIIAAITNNNGNNDIAGVAQVSLMAIKVYDGATTIDDDDFENAIRYAIDEGADIIHMSVGWPDSTGWQDADDLLEEAHDEGILLVASAGNRFRQDTHSWNVMYPANHPDVLSVGAMDWDYQVPDYSCNGPGNLVDMIAPGGVEDRDDSQSIPEDFTNDIASPTHSSVTRMAIGTSFAAPHVTGIASLVWSVRPDLTNDEVREIMRASCQEIGDDGLDADSGYGWLDAERAIEIARDYKSRDDFETPRSGIGTLNPNNVHMEIAMDIDDYGVTHYIYTTNEADFEHNPGGAQYHLKYKRIQRNGIDLGPDIWITDQWNMIQGNVYEPDIYVDFNNNIHITYRGGAIPQGGGGWQNPGDIFYASYTYDGNPAFQPWVRVTNNANVNSAPKVVGDRNGRAFIYWYENTVQNDIWYAGYSGQVNIAPVQKLFIHINNQIKPDVDLWWDDATSTPYTNIVWIDDRNGQAELFWMRLKYDPNLQMMVPFAQGPNGIVIAPAPPQINIFSMCAEYTTGQTHVVWVPVNVNGIRYREISPEGTVDEDRPEYYIGTNAITQLSIEHCINGDTYVVWFEDSWIRIQKAIDISYFDYRVIPEEERDLFQGLWGIDDLVVLVENHEGVTETGNSPHHAHDHQIRLGWVAQDEIYGDSGMYSSTRPIWRQKTSISRPTGVNPYDDTDEPDVAFTSDGRMHVVFAYRETALSLWKIRYQIWHKGTVEAGTPSRDNALLSRPIQSDIENDEFMPKIHAYYDEDDDEARVQILWLRDIGSNQFDIMGWTFDSSGNAEQAQPVLIDTFYAPSWWPYYDFDIDDDSDGYPTWVDAPDEDTDRLFVVFTHWIEVTQGNHFVLRCLRVDPSDLTVELTSDVDGDASDVTIANPTVAVNQLCQVHIAYGEIISGTSQVRMRQLNEYLVNQWTNELAVSNGVEGYVPDICIDRPVYVDDKGWDAQKVDGLYDNDDRSSRHDQKVHVVWVGVSTVGGDSEYHLRYRCVSPQGYFLTNVKSPVTRPAYPGSDGLNEYMGYPEVTCDYYNNVHIVFESDFYDFYSSPPDYYVRIYYLKLDTVGDTQVSEMDINDLPVNQHVGCCPAIGIKTNNEAVVIWEDLTGTNDEIAYRSHNRR